MSKPDRLTIADYEEVLADKRRLTRQLDVLMNGKHAAKQASLCDIVGQFPQWQATLLRREQQRALRLVANYKRKVLRDRPFGYGIALDTCRELEAKLKGRP